MTNTVDGSLSEPGKKSKIDVARIAFVSGVIDWLGEAFPKHLLSFRTVRGMNFEEVQIRMPYGEQYIVLGRLDKKQAYRPYAAHHTFRICRSTGEDAYWFEPLVLDDSADEDGLRNKLAALHRVFMSAGAQEENNKLADQLFEQSRFLRRLKEVVGLV